MFILNLIINIFVTVLQLFCRRLKSGAQIACQSELVEDHFTVENKKTFVLRQAQNDKGFSFSTYVNDVDTRRNL